MKDREKINEFEVESRRSLIELTKEKIDRGDPLFSASRCLISLRKMWPLDDPRWKAAGLDVQIAYLRLYIEWGTYLVGKIEEDIYQPFPEQLGREIEEILENMEKNHE